MRRFASGSPPRSGDTRGAWVVDVWLRSGAQQLRPLCKVCGGVPQRGTLGRINKTTAELAAVCVSARLSVFCFCQSRRFTLTGQVPRQRYQCCTRLRLDLHSILGLALS